MLLPVHHTSAAQWADWLGYNVPLIYNDLCQEYNALTIGAGVIDLSILGKLRVTGEDRFTYLQGQLSQDVLPLREEGRVAYSCLLRPTGQMLSDMFLVSRWQEVLVLTPPHTRLVVCDRLQRFVIMEDVQVEDVSEEYALLHVVGGQAEGVLQPLLGAVMPPYQRSISLVWRGGPLTVSKVNRCGVKGFDLFLPRAHADSLWQALIEAGVRPLGYGAFEVRRVEAGVPLFGVDMDETTIPLEAGIGELAICHTKGCYTGQEVIHRIVARGHTNRSLVGLRIAGSSVPARRASLRVEGRGEVGWITSVVSSLALHEVIGLGYLRNEYLAPGTVVTVDHDPPLQALVAPLPFVEETIA